jgi:hypothetical protein
LTGVLLVDFEFDAEQRDGVQTAVALWSDATQGRFAPQVRFESVQCGDSFAIEAVHEPGCSIGQHVDSPEGRDGQVLGATDPELHTVSIAAWLSDSSFRETVAHELGHYLLLGHGEGIMAQRPQRLHAEVAASSIREFCTIWPC